MKRILTDGRGIYSKYLDELMNILELFAGLWIPQTVMYQEVLQAAYTNNSVIGDIPLLSDGSQKAALLNNHPGYLSKVVPLKSLIPYPFIVCLIKYCV